MLCNGLGQYDDALAAAQEAWDDWPEWFVSVWALPELIEAAAKLGRHDRGRTCLDLLEASVNATGTEWGLGIAARSRALLLDGDDAERCYEEAIERLARTRLRPELARAHLLYGEWLHAKQRRDDARHHLGTAHSMFTAMGAEAFGERARHNLLATGATVHVDADRARTDLTSQEEHIARLARDGRTNVQIGAELYLSPRTVEWHLKKVFAKLGISSRRELRDALPDRG
jgi:DNA-binding CsgD family transcriptional regulator